MPILATIPQCHHIKDDGIRCGSPALRGKDLCYFHLRQARRHPALYIPPLTNRASIQLVVSDVMRAAFAGGMEDERLRTMLYALQIAISNLPHRERSRFSPDGRQPRSPRSPKARVAPEATRKAANSFADGSLPASPLDSETRRDLGS